jgi:endogenous inhibitor of DNA gyrase (YacG/DUF329 family)
MMTYDERKCPYCGKAFTPNSHNQKFCSYHCRWNNRAELQHIKRQKEKHDRPITTDRTTD